MSAETGDIRYWRVNRTASTACTHNSRSDVSKKCHMNAAVMQTALAWGVPCLLDVSNFLVWFSVGDGVL